MASTSWLAKHTRPLIVLSLVVALFVFITLDSLDISFDDLKTFARSTREGSEKFQSVNPPWLRSVGIPETPN